MERNLVLGRKPDESVTLFLGGVKVAEVQCRNRDTLIIKADDDVLIVRSELLERECAV